MGASKHFFTDLREGEQYVNISMSFKSYLEFKGRYEDEKDYTVNHIKQVNKAHREHEGLSALYKEKRKLSQEIQKLEQKLNHHVKQ